jgi:hypothetical protein
MEEEPTRLFSVRRVRNVGALANLNSFTPSVGKEEEEKDICTPGLTGTLLESCLEQAALRWEQQEWLESIHHRKI